MDEQRIEEQRRASARTLRVVGQMASGVSHEINNPLSVILGAVTQIQDLLKSGVLCRTSLQSRAAPIERAAWKIQNVICSMQNLAQNIQPGELAPEKVQGMVGLALMACFKRNRCAGIRADFASVPRELQVFCSLSSSVHAIECLLQNSVEALDGAETKSIRVSAEADERWVRIVFADSGPGVSPEAFDRIFDPFFSGKAVGKGVGLGLSIARIIALSQGGDLYLRAAGPNPHFILQLQRAPDFRL